MGEQIVTYRTKHFEFQVPIDEWNEKKIPLPKGAGAQFIAPSDLTAILLESFYYDWKYETDGRITWPPNLVYGEDWINRRISHFPWCKELFEFLDWLKKKYGWYIFASWGPFCDTVQGCIDGSYGDVVLTLQRRYNINFSGCILEGGRLETVDRGGSFWSASEILTVHAFYFLFGPYFVDPYRYTHRFYAHSVRCVSG